MNVMKEPEPGNTTNTPAVRQNVQDGASTKAPMVPRADDEDLAVLMPAAKPRQGGGSVRAVTRDDSLFQLVGIGRSEVEGGVSERKREFLARAYHPKR